MIRFRKKRHALLAYLLFIPFGVLLMVFKLIPFVNSVRMVFYRWDVFGTPRYIALGNFTRMFSDKVFWSSLWHTVYFVILIVPPIFTLSFLIAILINSKVRFKGLLRSTFYLP
ncbi:MAG: hypothetical protein ABDH53_09815, partial [Pseudothermotoga sp.]